MSSVEIPTKNPSVENGDFLSILFSEIFGLKQKNSALNCRMREGLMKPRCYQISLKALSNRP